MEIISKAVASIEPGEDDELTPHGSFHVILSAESKDRDGDVLRRDEWDTLPDWINFDADHAMTVEKTVGSGTPTLEDDGKIHVRGTYASTPLAQTVRTLVKEKHIRNTSVTFMTTKTQKDGKTVVKRELLNGAFVAVPANRDAIVLESKAVDIATKAGARNNATDAKTIQAIHDHAASLGASCTPAEQQNAASGEADGANKNLDRATVEAIVAEAVAKAATTADDGGYEPKPYERDPDETVQCPECGKFDAPDAKFCDQCGTKLAGRDDVKVEDTPSGSKSATVYVAKALSNSVEDLQARISDALSDAYSDDEDAWCWLEATFLDPGGSAGTIVYSLRGDSLSRTFTDDGNQVTLGDEVTDVTIVTTVVPEGNGDPDSKSVTVKSVSDKTWSDFSAADYSLEQYRAATLIHPAEESENKGDYKLPVKEPDGTVNRNAVHAAASALAGGRGGVDAPTEQKTQAAKTLVGLYRNQLKEDPPDSLLELAGESPKDGDTKSADTAAADTKSAAAVPADEEIELRARAMQIEMQALAV